MNYDLQRQGVLLRPDPTRPGEAGGVLNPTVYEAGGRWWIMYRSVAAVPENFSTLAVAELVWQDGSFETLRQARPALAPATPYELLTPAPGNIDTPGGGCEDPRVTKMSDGKTWWLTYTGYGGSREPRVALAKSDDGFTWIRQGLACFEVLYLNGLVIDLNRVDNKDAMIFPERINGRFAMLHRPMFHPYLNQRQSIWISYSDDMRHWSDHQLVAGPLHDWESLKLGGGTQPVRTAEGWLILYHGVEGERDSDPNRRYSAGAMVLDAQDPTQVVYRSPLPILTPDAEEERNGVVNNVVFPTGLWPAPDGNGWLVAYGMADWCIGWARLPGVPQ